MKQIIPGGYNDPLNNAADEYIASIKFFTHRKDDSCYSIYANYTARYEDVKTQNAGMWAGVK